MLLFLKAHIREKQAQEEVARLQDIISKLVDEAGARTRQEVDNIKKLCNQNLTKLMDELQRLELVDASYYCNVKARFNCPSEDCGFYPMYFCYYRLIIPLCKYT